MQVTNTIEKTRELVNNWKKEGKTIGLVPTMGYLHEGHASLIRRCRKLCCKPICHTAWGNLQCMAQYFRLFIRKSPAQRKV